MSRQERALRAVAVLVPVPIFSQVFACFGGPWLGLPLCALAGWVAGCAAACCIWDGGEP